MANQTEGPSHHYVETDWDITEVLEHIWNTQEPEEKLFFFNQAWENLIMFHHGFGTWIRNTFGLWGLNPTIRASMCLPLDAHPDEVSQRIIELYWLRVRDKEDTLHD